MSKEIGRPTDFREEYIKEADAYLKDCKDDIKDGRTNSVNLPSIERFALRLGANKTSLYEWAKKNEDFSNALRKIKQEQKDRLINNGLAGTYNSTIAKLVLSSNHGMTERADMTTQGDKINIYTDDQITAIASRIKATGGASG
jgi:hypothetical protein